MTKVSARAIVMGMWKTRIGKTRILSYSSVEMKELSGSEKAIVEGATRERFESTKSVVGARRSVRRRWPSMDEVVMKLGKEG